MTELKVPGISEQPIKKLTLNKLDEVLMLRTFRRCPV
jgi:hypothetical protein